jgi:hypothetical protein
MKIPEMWVLKLADFLPKKIVYRCLIKAGAYATTGEYSSTDASTVTFVEVLKRCEAWRK